MATPEHNVFYFPLWLGISSEFLEELEDAAKGKGDWSLLCCSRCSGDPAKFVKLYTSLNPWSISPLLNLLLLFPILCSVRAHLYQELSFKDMELHLNAALFLKGVSIVFVSQIPSGPFLSLFSSALFSRTNCTVCLECSEDIILTCQNNAQHCHYYFTKSSVLILYWHPTSVLAAYPAKMCTSFCI